MDFWIRRRIPVNLAGAALVSILWYLLAWVVSSVAFGIGLSGGGIETLLYQGLMVATMLIATLLVARVFDGMPAAWCGLGLHRWTLRELGLGVAIGGGMAALAWGVVALMTGVRWGDGWSRYDILYVLGPMALRAASEELIFRGYLFQRGVEIIGSVPATLLASVLFALAHLGNPNVTPLALLIIFLGGIFFSLGYLQTGSLWFPIGAHIAWNILLAKVLGLPVSGNVFGGSILRTTVAGPDWITGGAFGPEGGIVGVVALLVGIALLLRLRLVTFSPYVYAKTFRGVYWKQRREVAAG